MVVCKVCAYFCEYAKYAQRLDRYFQLYLSKNLRFTDKVLIYLPSVCKYAVSALTPPPSPGEHTCPLLHSSKTNTLFAYILCEYHLFVLLVCKVCAYFCEYTKYAQGVDREFQLCLSKLLCFTVKLLVYLPSVSKYAVSALTPHPQWTHIRPISLV